MKIKLLSLMCMAFICTFANAGLPSNEPKLSGDTYQIGNKAELLWYFNDERGFQHNAVLTNDITLEANIFEGGHVNYVASERTRKSIPQGITFDGNGHKIIGFCDGSSLFSTNNGTIKNLILKMPILQVPVCCAKKTVAKSSIAKHQGYWTERKTIDMESEVYAK